MMKKVLDAIEEYGMHLSGKHILVALSGGSDSMALLHVLLHLQNETAFTLTAAHVNHGIRGEEARRDEEFVQNYCEKRNIPIKILHTSVPDIMKQTGESSEECGRRIRYEFFASIAPHALIATAHNLDDCAETFLLNTARGTGLKGLTGIPPARGNIIRPLIRCTKEEILNYCAENEIPFVTDSTNLSNDYSRNRIRNQVLPILKSINPAFLDCFARSVSILEKDEAFLAREAKKIALAAEENGKYAVQTLLSAPPELLDRVVFTVLKELSGTTPEAIHVKRTAAMLKSGGYENLNGGKTVRSDGRYLFLREEKAFEIPKPLCLFQLPEKVMFNGKELHFSVNSPPKTETAESVLFQCSVNHDCIQYPLIVRGKTDGDSFQPVGRGMTKKLKKLFYEKQLSPQEKAQIVILADADGIIFAEGFGVDTRCAVNEETKNILYITISEKT